MSDSQLNPPAGDAPMRSVKVLIVEDSALIAIFLEEVLTDMGWQAIGPATSVAAACALAGEADIDAAIVDVNLHGEMAWDVASALVRRGVPFMFSTGYDSATIVPPCFASVPVIAKPFSVTEIEERLRILIPEG
jgi:DNA-binding response OmpR family regulator